MDMQFTAQDLRVVADSRVYEGHFAVRRISLQHRLFAGGWSETLEREVFERGDAVGVLPWDPVRDELVMLEQFRVGALRGAAGGVHGCAGEGEDIRVHALPRQQLMQWLAEGRISNGHTLVALQWLQIHEQTLRRRWS